MEWSNQYQGFFMVVLTAIYAFTTIFILRANRKTVEEARRAREEENRPYVIIYFEHKSNGIINLIIRNTGKTSANNVQFYFDKPLEHPEQYPLKDSNLIKSGIPSMPPDFSEKAMVGMTNNFEKDEDGKLSIYNVKVTYKSTSGIDYEETYVLDINTKNKIMNVRELEMHDLVKSVNELVKKVK